VLAPDMDITTRASLSGMAWAEWTTTRMEKKLMERRELLLYSDKYHGLHRHHFRKISLNIYRPLSIHSSVVGHVSIKLEKTTTSYGMKHISESLGATISEYVRGALL
jgi:hypothetical protein